MTRKTTYYFYDLETSGIKPSNARIMQFAGQRTDQNLQKVGEPDNMLIKLSDDVLPEPEAVLVHGITPQKTLEQGITEQEFTETFYRKIALFGTVFVGYNNIRFDDEFMRRACYRTFYDPYQWHWKDNRGRWDLLDPIRMMRALRPQGMEWPDIDGKPTVKLGLMTKANGLTHDNAHDALSDVEALIELAQKFREKQPKLYEYLLSMRNKKEVAKLVDRPQPFIYTSGRYSAEFDKTTVAISLFKHPRRDSALVYDLREDPNEWIGMSVPDLVKHWQAKYGSNLKKLPIKILQFNRSPAVAPIGVLDKESEKRLAIDMQVINKNLLLLAKHPEFTEKLKEVLEKVEQEQQTRVSLDDSVDDQLYDGFWNSNDQKELGIIRDTDPGELTIIAEQIKNERIRKMIPLYKARNYPKQLTEEESKNWEKHRRSLLMDGEDDSRVAKFYSKMQELSKKGTLSSNEEYILTELRLYVESIMPQTE